MLTGDSRGRVTPARIHGTALLDAKTRDARRTDSRRLFPGLSMSRSRVLALTVHCAGHCWPCVLCWPCTTYSTGTVQAQKSRGIHLSEFGPNFHLRYLPCYCTCSATLYSSGRVLLVPETDDPKPAGFLMHWQNSAGFGPNFHLYRYCADVRYSYSSTSVYGTSTGVLFWRNSTRKPTTRSHHQDGDMMMIIMMMMTTTTTMIVVIMIPIASHHLCGYIIYT